MAEIREGDYVRTIIEGRWGGHVTGRAVFEGEQTDGDLVEYLNDPTDRVYLEKIEAPVVTFGVGDVVRDPGTEQVFLLIKGGYVQVAPTVGQANPLDWGNGVVEEFTSDLYERVSVTL